MTTPSLSDAATALADELRKFESAASLACRLKLDGARNLNRASEAAREALAAQERIAARVQELVAAITAGRDAQQQQAAALEARANEIAQKRERIEQLTRGLQAAATAVKTVHELVQENKRSGGKPEELKPLLDKLDEAQKLALMVGQQAESEDLTEVARDSSSLASQVQSVRNKLQLLVSAVERA